MLPAQYCDISEKRKKKKTGSEIKMRLASETPSKWREKVFSLEFYS